MGLFSRNSFGAKENLDKISQWLSSPNAGEESRIWNYGRYAYITITSTGNNNAGFKCSVPIFTLGDTKLGAGENYESTILRDGDRDIPSRPILESVRISNDGSQDVSDAALYEVEVSFKCFSLAQFEDCEAAFFAAGNEVKLQFGYKGLGLGGELTSNVYDFGFSLDVSGVYSCNMKLTGRNRFASILSMTNKSQSESAVSGIVKDENDDVIEGEDIISELEKRFYAALPDFEDVDDGTAKAAKGYVVANIQTEEGSDSWFWDTDDMYVKYVTFEEFINVINWAHRETPFKWGFGEKGGAYIPQMCSADPSILLLDGDMANYSENAEGDTFNRLEHGGGRTDGHHSGFAIGLKYISAKLGDLKDREDEDKNESSETAINNFLRNLCKKIEELTGGLYKLTLYSDGSEYKEGGEFLIVNRPTEHDANIRGGYDFKFHTKGSVLKSVNMSSNFDADMAGAALVANRGGTIPKGALESLFKGCVEYTPELIELSEIQEKKYALGSGFSSGRVSALKSIMKQYVDQNPETTKTNTGYRYGIDLDVSHYGCWGTVVGDTFTFAGMPAKYKNPGIYFCVGKIEHTFDGQGGWDTSVTGFLKMDAL